jgi:DNA polymerase-3 subunit gamma/tau
MNVAELIASHGKGSYRDALGVLEQVLTSSGTAITYEHTLTFLGVTDKAVLVTLARGICTKDSSLLLESFASLQKKDLSPLQAYDDLVELFRVGLLFRIGEKEIFQKDSSLPLDTIESLAKEYPHSISSKTILTLLSSRHLVEVSAVSAWTAFQSIVISFTEEV